MNVPGGYMQDANAQVGGITIESILNDL